MKSEDRKTEAQECDGHGSLVTEKAMRLELKAFRLEMRLLIVLGLIVSRFQIPDVVTAGSVAGAIALVAIKSALARG